MMKYEAPLYRKCVKHFFNEEEAEAFIIQCYFDGNKYISTIYDEGYTVYYYDVVPKRRVKQMTVQEVIVKNNIGDFSLTFTNVLGIRIENPNPNIFDLNNSIKNKTGRNQDNKNKNLNRIQSLPLY